MKITLQTENIINIESNCGRLYTISHNESYDINIILEDLQKPLYGACDSTENQCANGFRMVDTVYGDLEWLISDIEYIYNTIEYYESKNSVIKWDKSQEYIMSGIE